MSIFSLGNTTASIRTRLFRFRKVFRFLPIFTAKSGLYKAELQSSQLQQQATASEIKAQVQYWFYQLQYLQTTKKQLQSLDSLYNDFVSAAALRYKTGETNLLEKTTAETKRGQLSLLLKQNETDFATAYNSLKMLMNTSEDFTIDNNGNFQPLVLSSSFDTTLIANNPSLKVLYQQAVIAEQNKKVETASTLPDFNVGYFNQSLIGVQTINGADVNFDGSKRFQGFNVGISIPITFFSNASK
jgi:cobalt-zinc-cadmium resistance protein CzcA